MQYEITSIYLENKAEIKCVYFMLILLTICMFAITSVPQPHPNPEIFKGNKNTR